MTEKKQIVLALESAIAGGSISLLRNGTQIAQWIGSANVSKAEDLLVNIDEILRSTNISRHEIDLIAASAGPGSFTGIRIGLATALGFKTGLGARISSVSALDAIAFGSAVTGQTVIVVPVGRNSVCVQRFDITVTGFDAIDQPITVNDNELADHISPFGYLNTLVHPALAERVCQVSGVTNIDANIAFSIGLLCAKSPEIIVKPLFISKSF